MRWIEFEQAKGKKRQPANYVRRTFTIEKDVQTARLSLTAPISRMVPQRTEKQKKQAERFAFRLLKSPVQAGLFCVIASGAGWYSAIDPCALCKERSWAQSFFRS